MKMPLQVVVMGVSGCGKTHVGRMLADRLDACFLDGDDFHPTSNRDKMAVGQALTDEDRGPWLASLAEELETRNRVVLACSALRRRYRDQLRTAGGVRFVFLDGEYELIYSRMQQRTDHFMRPVLLQSQFDALERPTGSELDVVRVAIEATTEAVVDNALRLLEAAC